ncbi:VIT1/CCC1 family predicted Fe2+/Mn2+ transporter [Frigoribacterium sp. PvP120]|uniref:VIT1/CCC1 transporter family protein n=1 Tax=unclassified Frigoribacterium TaxID=2627005 RepID=UPI001AE9588F|nr:VIT1/CCC1 family protein [Frigoribacterium sp. PvP121]MBP1240779.1 VIT1/CCC1 family predicted Fe2+/Mn2+ transporter [Frigoribacterium sp. PvP121]
MTDTSDLRRWRRYLADERAEEATYRDLARRRTGEERAILVALADAEARHAQHWLDLLGDDVGRPVRTDLRTRVLGLLARRFGSIFVLALVQSAEARSPYATDADATDAMAADERIHGEVVRGLAERGRNRLSGSFRAAVFGANDGLVSNLALVLGISASGVPNRVVLATGLAGLLAGALSMGAGEYVSVRSQRELLDASTPDAAARSVLPDLDVDANELALVYRARGMSPVDAEARARDVLRAVTPVTSPFRLPGEAVATTRGAEPAGDGADTADALPGDAVDAGGAGSAGGASRAPEGAPTPAPVEHETLGTALGAAGSSFCFFASGAVIAVLPYLFGLQGLVAVVVAAVLVGLALLGTGAVVGLLSGASPLRRALRQLAIGYGAAGATYLLGLLLGTGGL